MLAVLLGLAGAIVAAMIGAWAVLRTRDPTPSRLELGDVALPAGTGKRDRDAIFDIKLRNTGGQAAVLKRLVVHIERASLVRLRWPLQALRVDIDASLMPVTATYDVEFPPPGQAAGERITLDLSQVVEPGSADRFQVRACQRPYLPPAVYLVRLALVYDADGRSVTSAPLAAAAPGPGTRAVIPPSWIRETVANFRREVAEIRRGIDADLAAAGQPAVDWITAPPRSRRELPERLPSYDAYRGVYDTFWDPPHAIGQYLDGVEQRYRTLTEIIGAAVTVPDSLRDLLPELRATLAELPGLRGELMARN